MNTTGSELFVTATIGISHGSVKNYAICLAHPWLIVLTECACSVHAQCVTVINFSFHNGFSAFKFSGFDNFFL